MGCVNSEEKKNKKKSKFSKYQATMLKMMYDDLAIRSKQKTLNRQIFDTFFGFSGLWSQQFFQIFDIEKKGLITFQIFSQSIEKLFKSSFQEKVKNLFELYDVDKKGGISLDELLKMLFSFSTEELQQIFFDKDFMNSLDSFQKSYYFGPQKQMSDKFVIEQVEEYSQLESVHSNCMKKKSSEHYDDKNMYLQSQQNNKYTPKPKNKMKTFLTTTTQQPSKAFTKKKSGSLSFYNIEKDKKKIQITSNITSLVKIYAKFIFQSLSIDMNGEMSEDQFRNLINKNPQIINIYLEAFHSYIWMVNEQQLSIYKKKLIPWVSGKSYNKTQNEQVFLVFLRTTIFVYKKQLDKMPISVLNLEGLNVSFLQNTQKYGFILKHRDGYYPQQQFYFDKKEDYNNWKKHLITYQFDFVYDDYKNFVKLGWGNFSIVYKAIQKQSLKQVAIKVMEKSKLNFSQRQIIQYQCGILELCHHPNIVKFIKNYDTNTHLYIITQFLSEGDLFSYVKKSLFLEEYEASIILKQLIEATLYLHELGIIHRDLKPENVMIIKGEKGFVKKVKIIDFGFAVYQDSLQNLPQHQRYAGTPGFAAPQILLFQDYDEKVDTFSLGIMMYFMISGELPFYSQFELQIIQATIQCNINFDTPHWKNISSEAKDLLKRMLTANKKRISLRQVLSSPWIDNVEELKKNIGGNKKNFKLLHSKKY